MNADLTSWTDDSPVAGSVELTGRCLVPGVAAGEVLYSDVPLSFMGGVDPQTGVVIDQHHPLTGVRVTGTVLVLPSGRGSCSGSATLFEMLLNDQAPAALVFRHHETILTVGVIIADELFDRRIPVLQLDQADFGRLRQAPRVSVVDGQVRWGPSPGSDYRPPRRPAAPVALSVRDQEMLDGRHGPAAQAAIRVLVRAAEVEGAPDLIDVARAHLDGVFYQGPASLRFAETLRDLGATVAVPTTMNAVLVDRQRWRQLGVPAAVGEPSQRLADAYEQLGVEPTYTCAPYLLTERPVRGQAVAWAESNATMYANAVIGARTMKYPDYLDLLTAITGRAPRAGCYLDHERRATVVITVDPPSGVDDSYFPILGYLIGGLEPNRVPVITGLEGVSVSSDDLKAFGAAFATSSAAPMFHVVGATPEAASVAAATQDLEPQRRIRISTTDLHRTWRELNTATDPEVGLVALGNPHFSLDELAQTADLVRGRSEPLVVPMIITCGREVYAEARRQGWIATIEAVGGTVLNDTCWCFMTEPVVPAGAKTIMTNSGKYAHYGAAATGRGMHLRGLRDCVEAAFSGRTSTEPAAWLTD